MLYGVYSQDLCISFLFQETPLNTHASRTAAGELAPAGEWRTGE